jgi:hypothetical protein
MESELMTQEIFVVRTRIQVTEDQAKALEKITQSRHLSVVELIRKAVGAIIRSSGVIDIEERHKRALEIVGKFVSGKWDVSKRHNLYLMEAYKK